MKSIESFRVGVKGVGVEELKCLCEVSLSVLELVLCVVDDEVGCSALSIKCWSSSFIMSHSESSSSSLSTLNVSIPPVYPIGFDLSIHLWVWYLTPVTTPMITIGAMTISGSYCFLLSVTVA